MPGAGREYDDAGMDLDLPTYAAVAAELDSAGEERAQVLARHGLDEEQWEAIDGAWQQRLSDALDTDDDGVPELVAAYAAAYEQAQRAIAPVMALEQFAELTRLLQASGDVRASLAKLGLQLGDYVRASAHWTGRMAAEPELERRFQLALGAGQSQPDGHRGCG
jgi:hypothetical protein